MMPRGGGFACPSCGAEADLRNEDGSQAVLAPARRPGPGAGGLIAGLLVLAAGAGLWAALYFGGPGLPSPWPDPKPALREGIAPSFNPGLRDGLLATFGTPGEDEVLALAVLADARIGVLIRSRRVPAAGDDRLYLAFPDGSGTLVSKRLASRGHVRSAALASGPDGLILALVEDGDGVRLSGLDASGTQAWQHAWPEGHPGAAAPALLADSGTLAVTLPGAGPGTLVAAMLMPDGQLAWQRSFEVRPEGGTGAAPDAGALLITYLRADASGALTRRLLRLSASGETLADTRLAGGGDTAITGPPAGGRVQADALLAEPEGGARLLAARTVPVVSGFNRAGARLWETDIPGALLHDRIFLVGEPDGGASLVSAFRLSDIQTYIFRARLDAGGALLSESLDGLPPGAVIGGAAPAGGGRIVIAGQAGAGADADAFVLLLGTSPRDRPAGSGPAGAPARPGQVAAVPGLKPEPDPGPGRGPDTGPDTELQTAQVSGPVSGPAPTPVPGPVPVPAPAPLPVAAPSASPQPSCSFACTGDEGPFTIGQPVALSDMGGEAGLRDIQAALCRARGGAPDLAERPACGTLP